MPQLTQFIPCWLLTLTSFAAMGVCQSAVLDLQTADDKLQDLILKVRASHYDPLLGQSAIPALKEAFAKASDRLTKENLANVLVMYGQKDDAYWSTLYNRAQEIVGSSAPYPLAFDENGKSIRGTLSPKFLQWVKDKPNSWIAQ